MRNTWRMGGRSIIALTISLFLCLSPPVEAQKSKDKWKEYKKKHFIIYYKEAPFSFVKTVEENAEQYYAEIARDLGFTRYKGWTWEDRAKIYIYDNQETYVNDGKLYRWSHGVASPQDKVIRTFPAAHGFFDSTLPHELTHIIFREFVGYKTWIPGWFEEGVAMYMEKAQRWGAHEKTRDALENDAFLTLEELNHLSLRGTTDKILVQLYYTESASIVNYMISEFGLNRFVRFCRKLKEGKKFNWALDSVYVRFDDINDLNKAWVKFLKRQ